MNFEYALDRLKAGFHVAREGWKNVDYIAVQYPDAGSMNTRPYIYGVDIQGERVPWLASQVDLFAEDWVITAPKDEVEGPIAQQQLILDSYTVLIHL